VLNPPSGLFWPSCKRLLAGWLRLFAALFLMMTVCLSMAARVLDANNDEDWFF
jgi:hypothetical protein